MRVIHLGSVTLSPDHPDYGKINSHPGRWVLNHAIAQKRIGLDVEIVCMAGKASCNFTTEVDGVKVHFLRYLHPRRAMIGFIIIVSVSCVLSENCIQTSFTPTGRKTLTPSRHSG